jgi:mRNA interferase MazF
MNAYVPQRGDLVWLEFQPQAGHEQSGRRPALVLSPRNYNRLTGLFLVCPITSKAKGYPFEVTLPDGAAVSGVVLADQLKSLDWKARRAALAGKVSVETLEDAVALIRPLLEGE